jgi:hypothetical protein
LVRASGIPRPGGGDAKRIDYYYPGCSVWISTTTKEIIEKYYEWKKNGAASHECGLMDVEDENNVEDLDDGTENNYDTE